MELPGTEYLNTLSTLSITFVGFSALLIFFRQIAGGGMSKYDSYFVLTFMQTGFIVTIGSIIPYAIHSFGVADMTVWRIASFMMAVPLLIFVITLPARRKAVTGANMPMAIRISLVLQWLAAVLLLINVAALPFEPSLAFYVTALVIVLITAMVAFLFALGIIFRESK